MGIGGSNNPGTVQNDGQVPPLNQPELNPQGPEQVGTEFSLDDLQEFQRIQEWPNNFNPGISQLFAPQFEYYPPGFVLGDTSIPTAFVSPEEIGLKRPSEEDQEMAEERAYYEAIRSDYKSIIEPYPFLKDALNALALFLADREGKPRQPESYITIDLNNGTWFYTKEPFKDPNTITIPANDPNQANVTAAAVEILESRRAGKIDIAKARSEIETLLSDIKELKTPELSDRAHEQHVKVSGLEEKMARLQKELAAIEKAIMLRDVMSNDGMLYNSLEQFEMFSGPKRKEDIAKLDEEIRFAKDALRGMAKTLTLQQAMLALSQGTSEDDVLSNAGLTFGSLGFDNEAYEYFLQAHEAAIKLDDRPSQMQQQLYMIKFNPGLKKNTRVSEYFSYVDMLDDVIRRDVSDIVIDGGMVVPEFVRPMKEALKGFYAAMRAEAVSELVKFAAEGADDNPEDSDFVRAVALLDRVIEDATKSSAVNPREVAHLVHAATFVLEPFIKDVEDAVRQAELEPAKEMHKKVLDRAKKVEVMYAHLDEVNPEGAESPLVTNAFGTFGAGAYFYAFQRTGFAYEGVLQAFSKFVPVYPDSPVKEEFVNLIRDKAFHLFNSRGDYIPTYMHRYAPDSEMAEEEVFKSNFLPGSIPEQIGADLAGATIGAKTFAVVCTPLGPQASVACGTLGFVTGGITGTNVVRWMHSNEIDELGYQAGMAGMKLAGISRGEGDKNIAMSMIVFGLGAIFSPSGRVASIKLFDRVVRYVRPESIKYIAGTAKNEGKHFIKLFPAGLEAVKGFFGLAGRGKNCEVKILPVAEQIVDLLGRGSRKTRRRWKKTVEIIMEEARNSLTKNLNRAMNRSEDDKVIAELVKALMPNNILEGSTTKLDRFSKLLGKVEKGGMGQKKFERDLVKVLGNERIDTIAGVSKIIFGDEAGSTAAHAARLRDWLFGAIDSPDEDFLGRIMGVLKVADDTAIKAAIVKNAGNGLTEEAVEKLVKERIEWIGKMKAHELVSKMGPANVPRLLKLANLLQLEGTPVVQIERFLKDIVRDEKTGRALLEKILTSPTKEEVVKKAGKVVVDPHILDGLVTENAGEKVHEAVREVLKQVTSIKRLGTEDFFDKLKKIDGMNEFLEKVATDASKLASSQEGRQELLGIIAKNNVTCGEFLERVLGKGLSKVEKRNFSTDARDALLVAIIKPTEQGSFSKNLQYAMKDLLRPILNKWRATDLWNISDVETRAAWRINKRLLAQSLALLDDEGKEFTKSLVDSLAPWHKKLYAPYLDTAAEELKANTRKTLVNQVLKSMSYEPPQGILDPVLRKVNKAYDLIAGPLDRMWAKRIGAAAEAAVVSNPEFSFLANPLILRKRLLRNAYLASKTAAKGGAKGDSEELGRALKAVEKAYNWMSERIGTEEFRRAHRLCIPVAVGDYFIDPMGDNGLSEYGMVCAMFGLNYYVQKVGLGSTIAMDIIAVQRGIQTFLTKLDADSANLIDKQRTLAGYGENVTGIALQSFMQYGLNFAEKTPIGMILGNIPFVRKLSLAMNSAPFFGFFKGTVGKPEFGLGDGLQGIKRLLFTTGMSTGQSYFLGLIFQNDELFNASNDYAPHRANYYMANGAIANPIGFWVNKHLERGNPDADLRSTLRQLFERSIGVFTNYATLQLYDIYAGKGEYIENENQLLDKVIAGDSETLSDVWNTFADRFSFDLHGLWYGTTLNREWPFFHAALGRTPRFHMGAAFRTDQLKSWYSEDLMEFSDYKKKLDNKYQGYLVQLAKNYPERLGKFLEAVDAQMRNPYAGWRDSFFGYRREAHSKALYYFSLFAKYYAYKAREEKERIEYQPFSDFIASSKYKDYWKIVPECHNENELEAAIIRMEDFDKIESWHGMNLDDLLAHLRIPKASE